MITLRLTLALAFATGLMAQTRPDLGPSLQISGSIRGMSPKGTTPLLAIPVYLTRLPENPQDLLALNRLTTTDAAGHYTFDWLAPGRYRICPHSPGTTYLSPCDWDSKSQFVTVGPNQRSAQATQDFFLETGVILNISVQDEDGELTKIGRAQGLDLTIDGPNGPVRALQGAQFGRLQYLTAVVPRGLPAKVLVKTSAALQVDTEDQGARRQVAPSTGLSLAVGQETARDVRFFVRSAGRP